jgi:Domain of unknown function (DUF4139)/N-terminal domain of unknown function (DUF4140)
VNAPITSVTVLEDRASVTRRGRVSLAAGQHRVVVEGVAPVLVDKTLTAVAIGARVLDVRCERSLAPWRDPAGASRDAPAVLHAERIRLETARDAAQARLAAARAELAALAEVATAALRELAISAARAVAAPTASTQLAALDGHDAEARERRVVAELAVQDAQAALARLDPRIARAEAHAGEQVARLVIDLVVEAAGEVALTLGYIVPGAAWRPYHRAVLVRPATGQPTLTWQTTACVWQATGEDWPATELVCSLERPSLGVAPPALGDDELSARRRPETVTVEARDHEHQTTGLGGGPAQVPGIDDGGLGITLSAARATIVADGAPHRVPVGGFTSAAQLDLIAIPLRSPWVHLRVRLVNTGSAPLLAGPVDLVMASGYVGRTEVGFVAANEQVHLGFGPEADVRIHRDETRERDDAGLLGGWNVQTVRVAVRLSNLGTARREVVVTERIPISELEQVEVKASAPDAYLLGADDRPGGEKITQVMARTIDDRGLVSWTVELPPLGRRAVTLEYRVRSQRGVAGV